VTKTTHQTGRKKQTQVAEGETAGPRRPGDRGEGEKSSLSKKKKEKKDTLTTKPYAAKPSCPRTGASEEEVVAGPSPRNRGRMASTKQFAEKRKKVLERRVIQRGKAIAVQPLNGHLQWEHRGWRTTPTREAKKNWRLPRGRTKKGGDPTEKGKSRIATSKIGQSWAITAGRSGSGKQNDAKSRGRYPTRRRTMSRGLTGGFKGSLRGHGKKAKKAGGRSARREGRQIRTIRRVSSSKV